MSELDIRQAFETRLKELSPDFATAWENSEYKPERATPYQKVDVLFAKPENPTGFADDFHRQLGYMQISLKYPLNAGSQDAYTRAGLLKTHFKRGLSLTRNGVTATVYETPQVAKGEAENDRYVINVFIRFFANIEG